MLQTGGDDLVGEDITFLDHFAHIDVLHRVVVGAKLELSTHGVELSRLQRRAEGVFVRHIGLLQGAQDQVGRVIALAGIERGQTAVFLLEGGNKGRIGRIVEILVPLRGVLDPQAAAAPTACRMP